MTDHELHALYFRCACEVALGIVLIALAEWAIR